MQTKLTLRLESRLIEAAKAFAKEHGKSLSQIVSDYFASLTGDRDQRAEDELTPIVRALKGTLRGTGMRVDNYRQHLEKKHL
ncbi:MAG: antitoxin [Planctomycetes bacterium]|nr:antitoxin [Planctomycetota bacterium]